MPALSQNKVWLSKLKLIRQVFREKQEICVCVHMDMYMCAIAAMPRGVRHNPLVETWLKALTFNIHNPWNRISKSNKQVKKYPALSWWVNTTYGNIFKQLKWPLASTLACAAALKSRQLLTNKTTPTNPTGHNSWKPLLHFCVEEQYPMWLQQPELTFQN